MEVTRVGSGSVSVEGRPYSLIGGLIKGKEGETGLSIR